MNIVVILFVVKISLYIFVAANEFLYTAQISSDISAQVDEISLLSNQQYELLYGYELVYAQFLICSHEGAIQEYLAQVGSANKVEDVVAELKAKLGEVLLSFHQKFIHYPYRDQHSQPYKIYFKDFDVVGNFKGSNFIDFTYNLKLASQSVDLAWKEHRNSSTLEHFRNLDAMNFLVRNHESLEAVKEEFRNIDFPLAKIEANKMRSMVLVIVIMGIGLVVLFLIVFVRHKIKKIYLKIMSIFNFMDSQMIG